MSQGERALLDVRAEQDGASGAVAEAGHSRHKTVEPTTKNARGLTGSPLDRPVIRRWRFWLLLAVGRYYGSKWMRLTNKIERSSCWKV